MGTDIPRIEVIINGQKITPALDSATNYDYVRAGLLTEGRKTKPREVHLALGGQQYRSTTAFEVDISVGELITNSTLLEVQDLQEEVLLGHNWPIANEAVMDYRRQTTSAAKHVICLKEGSQPFRLPMYCYSDEKKRVIREQVEDMLR